MDLRRTGRTRNNLRGLGTGSVTTDILEVTASVGEHLVPRDSVSPESGAEKVRYRLTIISAIPCSAGFTRR